MEQLTIKPIGIIHTGFKEKKGTPIQGGLFPDTEGRAEIFPEYHECLKDLDGFSHLIFLYHFNQSGSWKPLVVPYLDDTERGVFSTRAPRRPNPIGMTVIELVKIEKGVIYFNRADMLEGTPLVDIKPFVPKIDAPEIKKLGWLEKRKLDRNSEDDHPGTADERF
ncbi:MAG: tRNA (N6-threonylcarbamoyladenosine(37)-N6)-methyltransferase TrmO [candidate division Zixibacteria bacterium]|nr:tRNA (N6-threonylcarbamoyladenosine(37)-N6)-methyltransferase TrmO [candidate division Zixibacteria bacterium]